MRVFMLKPLQLTAPREAGLPRAPGPCPGRRGQGFAPSLGAGLGGTAPTLGPLRLGELGAHRPSRPEQQPRAGRRRRPLRSALSEHGALSPHNPAARRGLGRGRPFHAARPLVPGEPERRAGGAGSRAPRGTRAGLGPPLTPPPRPRPLPRPAAPGPDAEHVQPAERLRGVSARRPACPWLRC